MKGLVYPHNHRGRHIGSVLALTAALCGGGITQAQETEPASPQAGTETTGEEARRQAVLQRLEAALQRAEEAAARLEAATGETTDSGDDPQARRARDIIDGLLGQLPMATKVTGGFEMNRDYRLIPDGDGYRVTFPSVVYKEPPIALDLGQLSLHIQPQPEGLATIRSTVGDLVTFYTEGDPVARVLIGEQSGQAIWDEAIDYMVQAQARVGDLGLVAGDGDVVGNLSGLSFDQGLDHQDDGTWSLRQVTDMTDLWVSLPQGMVSLDQLVARYSLAGRDFSHMMALSQEYADLSTQDLSEDELLSRTFELVGQIYDSFSQVQGDMVIGGLVVGAPDQPLVTLDQGTFRTHFDEAGEEGSEFSYVMQFADIQALAPGLPLEMLPTGIRLEVNMDRIPPRLMSRLMEVFAESQQMDDEEMQNAYIGQQMIGLLMSQPTGLRITESYIHAPAARMELSADARVNPESAFGATGEFQLSVTGMDRLMELSAALPDPSVSQVLASMILFSQRTEQEDGTVVDTFNLQVKPSGEILLNGKDMSALLGGGPGAPGMEAEPGMDPDAMEDDAPMPDTQEAAPAQ